MIAKTGSVRLMLDNLRSVHNTGSIFRTAETLGVACIYCVGTTPVPVDRFGRKRTDLAKVALGAEEMVSWEHIQMSDAAALAGRLRSAGCRVIALEQHARALDYKTLVIDPEQDTLVILGNEVEGVSPELLEAADTIAEIPHAGEKESLNVAVAAGIVLYRLFDRINR